MWVKELTKDELEKKSIHNTADFIGKYIKVTESTNPDAKLSSNSVFPEHNLHEDRVSYFKPEALNSVDLYSDNKACCFYEGFALLYGLKHPYGYFVFTIPYTWDKYSQHHIEYLTRDEFINECKSIMNEKSVKYINWDNI